MCAATPPLPVVPSLTRPCMHFLQIYGDGNGRAIVYYKCDEALKGDKIVSAGRRGPDTVTVRISTPRLCPCTK